MNENVSNAIVFGVIFVPLPSMRWVKSFMKKKKNSDKHKIAFIAFAYRKKHSERSPTLPNHTQI